MTHLNNTVADAAPLTSRQFLSFETIAGGVFALFVAIVAWVWNGHSDEFKALRSDVKAISLVIPTLATKEEMDKKLDKMATKEELSKISEKLDSLIVSVNTMQNTLTTQVALNSQRLSTLEKAHPAAGHNHVSDPDKN